MTKPVDLSNTILLRDEVLANVRPVDQQQLDIHIIIKLYPA